MLSHKGRNDFSNDPEYLSHLLQVLYQAALASTDSLEKCIRLLENELQSLPQPPALNDLVVLRRDQPSRNPVENGEASPIHTQPHELIIDIWTPETEYHKSSQVTSDIQPRKRSRQLSRTQTFFEKSPKTEEDWIALRKAAGLSDTDAILRVIDSLTTGELLNSESRNATRLNGTSGGLQCYLLLLAEIAGDMLSDAKLNTNVSKFYSLVFVATCSVALHDGHPQDLVDNALRDFLRQRRGKECDPGAARLSNLRGGVRWLIQEMERQCRRGLGHRAFELFFLRK